MTARDLEARPAGTTPGAEPARPPGGARRRWIVAGALVAMIAVVALVVRGCTSDDGAESDASSASSTLDPATQAAIDTAVGKAVAANGLPVSEIYSRIQPSVVEVDVNQSGGQPTGTGTGGDAGAGLGTGVIVNGDGTILTANHVVAGATTIEVVYGDGTKSTATVTAADEQQDIATLKPDTLPSVVVPAVLGAPSVVGAPVVAVGNPFGLDDTTTSGVISGLGRSARAEDGVQRTGLIQFDAAVNPGSSGGPLLNGKGEVIGIVTALANPTADRSFIGIGFAVPIATAVAGGGGNEPPK